MYKYRIVTIKNVNIEWYPKDPSLETHLNETYINTGIMSLVTISNESSNSTDILTKEVTFINEESFVRYKTDPLIVEYIVGRNAYEANNSIVRIKENIV